jgi:hypothetical protein
VVEWRVRNAVHLVLYYRYVRFHPDGSFCYRTSPEPLARVHKSLAAAAATRQRQQQQQSQQQQRGGRGGGGGFKDGEQVHFGRFKHEVRLRPAE